MWAGIFLIILAVAVALVGMYLALAQGDKIINELHHQIKCLENEIEDAREEAKIWREIALCIKQRQS